LGVIAELADEVAVMYGGRIVERATVHQLYEKPYHPYSQGLLRSIPRLTDQSKSKLQTIEGMVPSIFESLPGCRFQNRCQYANDECRAKTPPLIAIHDTANHEVACFNVRKKRDSVSA
jgi:oligopeptide/dipeptide ABC transporter ATP-binding protein